MSLLEELLNKYCPDGVEYVELNSVIGYEQPSKYIVKDTKYNDDYDVPVLTAGQSFILGYTNEKDGIYKANKKEPVIIFDDFTTSFHWVDFNFKVKSSAMKMLKVIDENKSNFRYLYYCMKNIKYIPIEHARQWIEKYSKFTIPLPPIEVQKEIMRILDTFTEYQDYLNEELKLRKKQYEYYQNKLLFNTKFNKIKMSDICTVNQGLQIPISQRKREEGKNRYFYITVQFLKGNNQDKYYIENPSENVICNTDDILVTRTGSTGKIITGVKGCFHNNFFKLNFFDNVNKRYVYYVLNTKKMYEQMLNAASGGTVPDLPHKAFYKLEIYFPPLEEQERIVKILDRFEALCNDISSGLPAEIEMRKKQYEYYRDKLLTFEEKKI